MLSQPYPKRKLVWTCLQLNYSGHMPSCDWTMNYTDEIIPYVSMFPVLD